MLREIPRPRIDICLLSLAALVFTLWPQLDLWSSGLFFDRLHGGFGARAAWAQVLYDGTAYLSLVLALGVLLAMLATWRRSGPRARRWNRKARFLALCFLLGPVIAVNAGLKEHWGRARPRDVVAFHGQQLFTPALEPAAECRSNCSFVSGHASIGFALLAFAFVSRARRLWLLIGIAAGSAIGLARIEMGGHFLSDVVFSGLVVWFSIRVAAWVFSRRGRVAERAFPPRNRARSQAVRNAVVAGRKSDLSAEPVTSPPDERAHRDAMQEAKHSNSRSIASICDEAGRPRGMLRRRWNVTGSVD